MELTGGTPDDYLAVDPQFTAYGKVPLHTVRRMVERRVQREVAIVARALDALHPRHFAP